MSAGWFLYNGALVRFTGSSYSFLLVGHAIYVQITSSATPLTFNDASTPNVIEDVTANTVSLVSTTADSSTVFQLAHLQDFYRETAWSVETFTSYVTGLEATGTIKYKKNYLDNTLSIVGNLTTPGGISLIGTTGYLDGVGAGTLMFTLPSGYIPNNKALFVVDYDGGSVGALYPSTNPTGSLGSYGPMILNNIAGTVNSDGKVYIKFFNTA